MGRKATLYLLSNLFILFSIAVLVAAVTCRYAPYAPLSSGWLLAGLTAPVLFGLNLVLLVWWLIRRRWFVSLIPLAALIVGTSDMLLLVQPPRFGEPSEGDLRVASLNVHGFQQERSRDFSAHRIAEMLRDERIDVVCMQEVLDDSQSPFDSLAGHFVGRGAGSGMPYYVRELSMACFSRYPIVDHEYVRFSESNQSYLRVDVQVNDRLVRFISLHLQTTGLSMAQRHFRKNYNMNIPADSLCNILLENAAVRMVQVAAVRKVIESSPMPVIVLGDFNDTPMSKTYYTMCAGLTDAFCVAGHGFATTFLGLVRIDYILYNDYFAAADYYVWRGEAVSDHSPVIAALRFAR